MLLLFQDTILKVDHTEDEPHEDEGFLQKANISLARQLEPNEYVYIAITAENEVIYIILCYYFFHY